MRFGIVSSGMIVIQKSSAHDEWYLRDRVPR